MEILTLFLLGTLSFPLDSIGNEATIEKYKNGELVSQHRINDTKKIAAFFKSIENDWQYDIASYAPVTMIYSGNIKINCGYGIIVANFRKKPDDAYTQISKKIAGTCPDFLQ